MLDYRYILERLYEFRGRKSGKNWLIHIDELESYAPHEKYVELKPYISLIKIKTMLVKNKKKMIHSSILRSYIEDGIHSYDEFYIGEIENLLYLIEYFSDDEEYKDSILLRELQRIFLSSGGRYL